MLLQDTTIAVLDAATTAGAEPLERAMTVASKTPVVLAVVLVVWLGLLTLVLVTERRLARLERRLDDAEGAAAPRAGS